MCNNKFPWYIVNFGIGILGLQKNCVIPLVSFIHSVCSCINLSHINNKNYCSFLFIVALFFVFWAKMRVEIELQGGTMRKFYVGHTQQKKWIKRYSSQIKIYPSTVWNLCVIPCSREGSVHKKCTFCILWLSATIPDQESPSCAFRSSILPSQRCLNVRK